MCESYVQPYSKPWSSASFINSTKRECGGSGRTVTPNVSIEALLGMGRPILFRRPLVVAVRGPVGHGAHDLDEVGLRDAVREAQPACGRRRRGLRRHHLDDRDAAVMQLRRLVSADEPSAEDDCDIDLRKPWGRLALGFDGEAGFFEQAAEIGLASREKQQPPASVSVRLDPLAAH